MNILKLIPTHNKLRTPRNLEFFRKNQVFPIALSRISGKLYVHDGHHRLVSYILEGKKELPDTIFSVRDFTKAQYLEFRPNKGWVTPFDIEKECRLPEFANFKRTILERWSFGKDVNNLLKDIKYKEPREIFSMEELAKIYDTVLPKI